MDILITTIGNYPHIGGKSTHIKNLTKGLLELGHHVNIISFTNISSLKMLFLVRFPGFLIRKLPMVGKKLSFYWTALFLEQMTKSLIKKELKKNKYDAISAQDVIVSAMCKKIIDNLGIDIPIITTVHGDYANEILSAGFFLRGTPTEKWLLEREITGYLVSDLIISVDNRLKEHVTSLTKNRVEKQKNIKVMFNFLDLSEFTPVEKDKKIDLKKQWSQFIDVDAFLLLCPRRLTAKNGVIYPALMCQILNNSIPGMKFQLVYAGDGEDKSKINEIIQENGLQKNIIMLGDVKHEDMRSLYRIADVVLVPSVPSEGVIEATSLSALEAMASGVSIIASGIGGLAELIRNGENGLLVEPKNAIAIKNAVIELFSNKKLKQTIESNAYKYVNEHHSHIVAAKQFALYCKDLS